MQDLCVTCGNDVPEGRQVCPTCEADPMMKRKLKQCNLVLKPNL